MKFRLSSLLLLVAIVAVVSGWLVDRDSYRFRSSKRDLAVFELARLAWMTDTICNEQFSLSDEKEMFKEAFLIMLHASRHEDAIEEVANDNSFCEKNIGLILERYSISTFEEFVAFSDRSFPWSDTEGINEGLYGYAVSGSEARFFDLIKRSLAVADKNGRLLG